MARQEFHRKFNKQTMGRQCGPCSACCTYLGIEELQKPSNVTCKHLTGAGHAKCSIYANRPEACRKYKCSWLEGMGPEWLKPNRSGILITVYPAEDNSGKPVATVNIFDESKTTDFKIKEVVVQLLMLGCIEVRQIHIQRMTGRMFKNGNVYECKMLPPEGYESLTFEMNDQPIGRYSVEG